MKKVYKVLLIGSKSRTDIINKAKKLHLSSIHSSTAGMTSFNFDINKEKILLQVWESAASEKIKPMLPSYCKDSNGIAFVFDINQRSTFDEISQIIPIAQSNSPKDACFFLIGVKCDREEDRQVSDKEASALVKQYHLKSAKFSLKDESTSLIFSIARIVYNHKNAIEKPPQPSEKQPSQLPEKQPPQPSQPMQKVDVHADAEVAVPNDQANRQLLIAQKHEKFFKDKVADLELKLKEANEKLEKAADREKQLNEKVNYLTKKLHAVTVQKLHQEQGLIETIPECLVHNEIPVLTVSDVESVKRLDDLNATSKWTVTKVSKEDFYVLRTFQKNSKEEAAQTNEVADANQNTETTEANQNTETTEVNQNPETTEANQNPETTEANQNPETTEVNQNPETTETQKENKPELDKHLKFYFKYIQNVSKLDHPCIVKNYGFCFGDETHSPTLLSEFVGLNLQNAVKDMKDNDKVASLFAISSTLKTAHSKGIFHARLNPHNILVDSASRVKIADFGLTLLDNKVGESPEMFQFLAPEQFGEDPCVDEKVDVFAFGSLMFFVLTGGELPQFTIEDLKEAKKVPEIPPSINQLSKELIESCWKFDPKERPSFAEIIEKIEMKKCMLIDDVDTSQLNL